MLREAEPAVCDRELARLRARQGNQLLNGLRRHVVVHRQDVGREGDLGDRREVLDRIVRQRLVEAQVGDDRGVARHHQRVAVGRGLGDEAGREAAAGADLALHHHRLAPGRGELVADQARRRCRWGRPAA